jgi:3-oxoacyl-[acyl-carrier-protein] synthase-1
LSKNPLSVVGLGMVSCLGEGAEITAAAMRCEYDGFQQTEFKQPFNDEFQIGAKIESELHGIKKLCYMSANAVEEAIQKLPKKYQGLNVIYCMPDKNVDTFFNTEEALRDIIAATFKKTHIGALNTATSTVFWQHRCGFISALKHAQDLLYHKNQQFVLIVTIDSLLNNATLRHYGGELNGDNCRLYTDDHSNGFIPGEASTAVLLTTPDTVASDVVISGIGDGFEYATVDNENEVLKGNGLATAVNNASQDAGVVIHDTHFRVSSLSGEDYFFTEAALVQIKTLKQKVNEQALWHPADNIGEVGAAIGGALVIMTYYAFIKHYAPGKNALCQISNDNALRGAFIMQYTKKEKGVNNGK